MAQKPALAKGTRDFSSEVMAQRNYIFDTIKKQFHLYGFAPIETPSFEKSHTLLGKYGEEGDRLIFKILNSGDYLKKVDGKLLAAKASNKVSSVISEKALRYDLTVPFARYVVMHQNELTFPFKRYQIQPVWRADRPQKGRYREFYQCDADVVGSKSLWQEVELVQLYDAVFHDLNLTNVSIKINNRKILQGIAEVIGAGELLISFTVALDKLDKIGVDGVKKEMLTKGIAEKALEKLEPLFHLEGDNASKLNQLAALLQTSEIGLEGIEELRFVTTIIADSGLQTATLDLDITLARGLNYYTGAIFEVVANDVAIGSIGGGGRYDDLTSIFGLKDMSGIGISFGLDRIYLVLEALDLFPKTITNSSKVLFINFGASEAKYCYKAVQKLRKKGVAAELYPDATKMKKQMNYANKKTIPFVVLAGEDEVQANTYTLKNMLDGTQETVDLDALIAHLLSFVISNRFKQS